MLNGKYSYSISALSLGYGRDELKEDGGGWKGCCMAVVVAALVTVAWAGIELSTGTVADADRLGRGRDDMLCVLFCILAGGAPEASGLALF